MIAIASLAASGVDTERAAIIMLHGVLDLSCECHAHASHTLLHLDSVYYIIYVRMCILLAHELARVRALYATRYGYIYVDHSVPVT